MSPVLIHTQQGTSLVELIVAMAVFAIIIGITGSAFNSVVSNANFQTHTAESNIAGIVGLELMRADVESAGYGLFWSLMGPISYSEASNARGSDLNDNERSYASDATQNSVARAVASLNDVSSTNPANVFNGSDILAIRSMSVATDEAARRWNYVESQVLPTTNPSPAPRSWSSENLADSDRVVVMLPVSNMKPVNQLVVSGTAVWSAAFSTYSTIGKPRVYNDAEKKMDAYVIYGVKSFADNIEPRMPFNRADYYVRRPGSSEASWSRLPRRCNPSSGILYKGIVRHADGDYDELPLLECVLDFQVVFGLLTPGSSTITVSSDISDLSPSEIREQVKEIHLYILTHDGGIDRTYSYPNATIGVGPGDGFSSGTGRTINFASAGIPDWQHYRWRVYQIVGRPRNLAGSPAQ